MDITWLDKCLQRERHRAQSQEQQLEEWIAQECSRAQDVEAKLEERIQKLEQLIGTMTEVTKDFGSLYAGREEV